MTQSGDTVVRVAVVGCGVIARQHARHLRLDPRCEVVACCDLNRGAADALRAAHFPRAAIETDFSTLLKGQSLDALVVCSPTPLHFEQLCGAFEARLHVLCEKPLAFSRAEIVELAIRRQQAERVLSVAYQRRSKAAYRQARHELHGPADRYGKLRQVHIYVCERWQQTIAGTWRDDPRVGAGYFGDAGSHQVDICHFLTDLAAESLLAVSDRRGSQVEVVTQVLARLPGGVGLNAHFVGDAQHWREDLHFHCEQADLLLRSEELWRAHRNNLERIEPQVPASSPVQGFLDSILTGEPPVATAESALPVHDWTAAVLESVRSGGWVDLPARPATAS